MSYVFMYVEHILQEIHLMKVSLIYNKHDLYIFLYLIWLKSDFHPYLCMYARTFFSVILSIIITFFVGDSLINKSR